MPHLQHKGFLGPAQLSVRNPPYHSEGGSELEYD